MSNILTVTDPNNVPVTFVNQVLGQGHANGVINLTLGVARWTPVGPREDAPNGVVEVDMVIASRLRMDLQCAKQMRDSLNELLSKLLPGEEDTKQ